MIKKTLIRRLKGEERDLAADHWSLLTMIEGKSEYGPQSEEHKSLLEVQAGLLRSHGGILLERIKLLEKEK